jgi:membrane fusion protein, multidrug efflux system
LKAQVQEQQSVVNKKRIKAPFSGRLGIRLVNLGQFINPGDKIVTLQTLDPIYVNFNLPQQSLRHIAVGQTVNVVCDAYPKENFVGKITSFNPNANQATRNIEVQATFDNPDQHLLPGMYATANVDTGRSTPNITLPQTAVIYNAYGSIVYVVKETGKDKKGEPILTAEQNFVTLGDTRGDQVAILKGIKAGDLVVTCGQVKIKNGSQVTINNKDAPDDNPNPLTKDT